MFPSKSSLFRTTRCFLGGGGGKKLSCCTHSVSCLPRLRSSWCFISSIHHHSTFHFFNYSLNNYSTLNSNMSPVMIDSKLEDGAAPEQSVDQAIQSQSKKRSATDDSTAKLFFAKLSDNASAPTKGSKLAAGFDLKSAYDVVIPKRGSALVKTDIQIRLPQGTYGRIAPRSGLALKNRIDVGAGVVDEDYRGNIGVILFNHSDEDFEVTKGDRIAQLICEKVAYPDIEEVDANDLDSTERGEDGFGSTGVKKPKTDEDEPGAEEVEVSKEEKPVEKEEDELTETAPKSPIAMETEVGSPAKEVKSPTKVLTPRKQDEAN